MGKIKTVIVLPDLHLTDKCPRDYLPVKRFIKEIRPDEVILLGDFMDIESLSAWDYDKKRLMENKRYKREIVRANEELDFLQKYSKKVTYLEGNHEDRINRYLDKNPEMEGMIELEESLNLSKRKIVFHKMNDLYRVGDMHFTHGMWTSKYNANKHLTELGCNVCYGHQHKTQTSFQNQAMAKPIMAYALGTLGDKKPDYLKNRPGNWINQFGMFYYNQSTGNFNMYPVNIIKNKFIWNGKVYR